VLGKNMHKGDHGVSEIVEEKLHEKMKKIRLLILDVDGVMTDGKIIIDDVGNEVKHFNVRDGHGIKMLMKYGIDVVLLTGRRSKVVEHRAKDLGISEVHQGAHDKLSIFEAILRSKALRHENIAFVGDDIVDVPVLKRAGFSVAVADAAEHVKKCVDYITHNPGGAGAVREVCEMILGAQDKWGDIVTRYEL
jgi:3-deoxy-D-manno-octulosonate 8-phosphate phosphatase (KDO 8-P phosphatase)